MALYDHLLIGTAIKVEKVMHQGSLSVLAPIKGNLIATTTIQSKQMIQDFHTYDKKIQCRKATCI